MLSSAALCLPYSCYPDYNWQTWTDIWKGTLKTEGWRAQRFQTPSFPNKSSISCEPCRTFALFYDNLASSLLLSWHVRRKCLHFIAIKASPSRVGFTQDRRKPENRAFCHHFKTQSSKKDLWNDKSFLKIFNYSFHFVSRLLKKIA